MKMEAESLCLVALTRLSRRDFLKIVFALVNFKVFHSFPHYVEIIFGVVFGIEVHLPLLIPFFSASYPLLGVARERKLTNMYSAVSAIDQMTHETHSSFFLFFFYDV